MTPLPRSTLGPLPLALAALLACSCSWPLVASAQTGNQDVLALLEQRYSLVWNAGAEERARWNCPEGRLEKPSGTVRYNWICTRPDPKFFRVIVWRTGAPQAALIERDNFRAMAGGKDAPHGEPDCTEAPYRHPAGHIAGSLKTCRLPLPNGSFHVAFAHVETGTSALSLVVRNASPQGSTPRVKDDLLSWLEDLQPVSEKEKKQ